MKKIILDVDTGEDDAIAILIAVMNKLPLTHIITSYGNTTLEHSTRNTGDILHLAQADWVEVIKGASKPLQPHPFDSSTALAGDFVGKNGLCDITLEPNTTISIHSQDTSNFIKKMEDIFIEHGKTDYIITGPQTNFAILCKALGNRIQKYIDTVYIMGGAIHVPGNSGPDYMKIDEQLAEFNIYCDPFATEIVLNAGLKLRYITWDVCRDITIPYQQVQNFSSSTPVGKFTIELMKKFLLSYGIENHNDFELSDPITVLACMGYGEYRNIKILAKTDTEHYGQTIEDAKGISVEYFMLPNPDGAIQRMLKDLTITV